MPPVTGEDYDDVIEAHRLMKPADQFLKQPLQIAMRDNCLRDGKQGAVALAAGLCGLGQGKATASATEALARNPGARAGIQLLLVLGLAFIESLTLFTLVVIFLEVK